MRQNDSSPGALRKRMIAFSLVELLVVMAIISLLAAMLLPVLQSTMIEARKASCASQLHQFGLALTEYQGDNGFYPSPYSDNYVGMNDSNPGTDRKPCNLGWLWDGGYLRDVKIYFCPHQDMPEAWRNLSYKQNVNKIKGWTAWARSGYSLCYLTVYRVTAWSPFTYVRKTAIDPRTAYVQCSRNVPIPANPYPNEWMSCHKDKGVNSLALDTKVWWLPHSVFWDIGPGNYYHNIQSTSWLFTEATSKR